MFNVSGPYKDDWDSHPDHGYDKFFLNIQKQKIESYLLINVKGKLFVEKAVKYRSIFQFSNLSLPKYVTLFKTS